MQDTKVRNYYVDDATNRDWLKVIPRIRAAMGTRRKDSIMQENVEQGGTGQGQGNLGDAGTDYCYCEECNAVFEHLRSKSYNEMLCSECGGVLRDLTQDEVESVNQQMGEKVGRRVRQDKVTLIERIKKEWSDLMAAVNDWLSWAKYEDGEKVIKYQVQPFHSSFDKADENAKWAFSAEDGNAILDEGGWVLYKQVHLVVDVSDDATPENKGAYTYPVAKLVDGKPAYFLKSAQTVYTGLRGGARGADLPKDVDEKVLATVKKIYDIFGRETKHMELKGLSIGNAFAFKALDGEFWWLQFTSNAFRDREGEIFTTKSLSDYVERHRNDAVKGQFWYRHMPGAKFADVRWQAMVGRFLVQAGPFDSTPVGQAFKLFFSEYTVGHHKIAPNGWGTSHGYYYDYSDRKDGVYDWLEIKESTVLPLDVAANTWSPMPLVIWRSKQMNKQEQKELETIGGKQLVDLVLAAGIQHTEKLENAGIGFKGMPDLASRLLTVSEQIEDEDIRAQLEEIVAEMSLYEVIDESVESEIEVGYEEAEMDEGEVKQVKGVEVKQVEGVDALTREEIADALKSVVTTLRDEIKAANDGVVASVADSIKPLVDEVKAMKQSDSKKIAKKIEQTPAASLRDMIASVKGLEDTAVTDDDALLGKGPQQANPKKGGLFFEQFMGT